MKMDDEKKENVTEAEQQIARLMKMKIEKDKKERQKTEFLPNDAGIAARPKPKEKAARPAARPAKQEAKKQHGMVRIERRLYEKLHRIVNGVNATGGARTTKAKAINLILREFLSLDIDYRVIKSDAEMKKLFMRLKNGI